MPRYHPGSDIEPIFEAAQHWKRVALRGRGSMLSERAVWSDESLALMNQYFVENLDYGEGNFMQKLEGQLAPASPETKMLAAEMTWFMLLCPSNTLPATKRATVEQIWTWSNTEPPLDSPWLADDILQGVGSAGTAYNTQRWRELVFFVRFLQAFRSLPEQQQEELLTDGWAFAEWLQEVPEADVRQLRHMILYLLFPDQFDRIFGRGDRKKLLEALTTMPRAQINRLSALEMSKRIQEIRRQREEQYQTRELDFYEAPLLDEWRSTGAAPVQVEDAPVDSPFTIATANIERSHVIAAIERIRPSNTPADARSTTYDLIYNDDRLPPKYVLSLAAEAANGEQLPRSTFTGGLDSPAFRVLARLGFHIELKEFLTDLVSRFVAQADREDSLVVREYPREYRGLKVKVSFGQGVIARVPWISFTGYDQTTSNGIYPVLLYFKSAKRVVVAYGISETEAPAQAWSVLEGAPSIESYFSEQGLEAPVRYGHSHVFESFDLADELDAQAVEKALDRLIGVYHHQFEHAETAVQPAPSIEPYGLDEALDGLFIEEAKFAEVLAVLRHKRNLILQGPPGVGKTFVCKRLAYALMEEKAQDRVGMIQFHQSYSYEDFIQGYRPSGDGFKLKNGIFYDFAQRAKEDPANTYVFVIDEINRGNLSKIFGELMLLVEADKRGPEWAIPLPYSSSSDEKFYIPTNLYLIGLMNTADRSLAMVDYALRRRFAFVNLEPGFDTDEYRQFLTDKGAEPAFLEDLIQRLADLNDEIAKDTANLGPGYCIGHSYFASVPDGDKPNWNWYQQIVRMEIEPLLREYYFDDESKAISLVEVMLRNAN